MRVGNKSSQFCKKVHGFGGKLSSFVHIMQETYQFWAESSQFYTKLSSFHYFSLGLQSFLGRILWITGEKLEVYRGLATKLAFLGQPHVRAAGNFTYWGLGIILNERTKWVNMHVQTNYFKTTVCVITGTKWFKEFHTHVHSRNFSYWGLGIIFS